MEKWIQILWLLVCFVFSSDALAQASRVFKPRPGNTAANLVHQKATKGGLAANDSRYGPTWTAMTKAANDAVFATVAGGVATGTVLGSAVLAAGAPIWVSVAVGVGAVAVVLGTTYMVGKYLLGGESAASTTGSDVSPDTVATLPNTVAPATITTPAQFFTAADNRSLGVPGGLPGASAGMHADAAYNSIYWRVEIAWLVPDPSVGYLFIPHENITAYIGPSIGGGTLEEAVAWAKKFNMYAFENTITYDTDLDQIRLNTPATTSVLTGGTYPSVDQTVYVLWGTYTPPLIWTSESVNVGAGEMSATPRIGVMIMPRRDIPTGTTKTMTQIAALTDPVGSQVVDYQLVADMSTKLWQAAAAQPDYAGVPYTGPITAEDVKTHVQTNPTAMPRLDDWMNSPQSMPTAPIVIAPTPYIPPGETTPITPPGSVPGTDPPPGVTVNMCGTATTAPCKIDWEEQLPPDPGTPRTGAELKT
ncbi:MAG TPA: hypothetical protein VK642_13145, partial [Burkholderiales bacterium]|nr:hypothetical protein [Burkholderiales bacterium]